MATNKNQHFVPRAYFKPFSVGEEAKAIHLFNLDQMRAIFNAPLKNQCSANYFYGQNDSLESAIQIVEGSYAACIAALHEKKENLNESNKMILRRFVYLQHIRTETAARRATEFVFAMTSVRGADIEKPSFKDAVKNSVLLAMRNYAETMKVVDDLKVQIVRNNTCIPIITSDDPAIIANRWHQKSPLRAKLHSFGSVNAGILFFLPLSPFLLAVLFDGDVYKTDHCNGWVEVAKPTDIVACNDHQILNCAANLYFSNPASEEYIATAVTSVAHLRPLRRYEVFTAILDSNSDTHRRYKVVQDPDFREYGEVLTHVRAVRPKPLNWPSFLKFRNRRFVFTNDTGAGFRRRATAVSTSLGSAPWRKIKA